jgi:hypothetical protein
MATGVFGGVDDSSNVGVEGCVGVHANSSIRAGKQQRPTFIHLSITPLDLL